VREHGCIHSAHGLGVDGHACWAFDSRQHFVDAALEFLTDGLRFGQRLAYVGSEPVDEQRERLELLGNVSGLIDGGALQLFTLSDLYRVGEPIDPDTQLAIYDEATKQALADGFNGLRVAAQVTGLVAEPGTWEAHVRWESIADGFMAANPLSALCGYERDALPENLLGDLATVHPAARGASDLAPFHLFSDSGNLALEGEVDLFSAKALDRVFPLVDSAAAPNALDLGELDFIDHHGLRALAGHTRRLASEGRCTVQNAPPIVDRLCDLLELKL
jgi:anti-anti-sigma regulatory factor